MVKKVHIFLLLNVCVLTAFPQTGGDNVYEFLNLTHSGLVSSLGGTNVSIQDNLNLAPHNPAVLNQSMSRSWSVDYVNYFAGINYGQAIYSMSFPEAGNFAGGLSYLNYGTFNETDVTGVITGTFTASEYAFLLIYSRNIDSLFSIGVDLKPVLSHLERYTSFGFAVDLGASWHNRKNLFSAGFVIKNMGYQVTSYAGEPHQNLPFEIQAGISQRLPHAPFRFSMTLRHLEKFKLTHDYNTTDQENEESSEFVEDMLRHVILGAELIPHKNFYFSGGYNYQRGSEMKIDNKTSAAGFSWGFGINTSWLNIEFGRATYHLAGSSTHISMIIRPYNIYKRSTQ